MLKRPDQTLELQHLLRLRQNLIDEQHFIRAQFETQIALLRLRFKLQLHLCQTEFELGQIQFRYQAEALFYQLQRLGVLLPDNLLSYKRPPIEIKAVKDSLDIYTIENQHKNILESLEIDPSLWDQDVAQLGLLATKVAQLRQRIGAHVQSALDLLDVPLGNTGELVAGLLDRVVGEVVGSHSKVHRLSINEILNPVEEVAEEENSTTKIPLASILSTSEERRSMLKISSVLNDEHRDYYLSLEDSESEEEDPDASLSGKKAEKSNKEVNSDSTSASTQHTNKKRLLPEPANTMSPSIIKESPTTKEPYKTSPKQASVSARNSPKSSSISTPNAVVSETEAMVEPPESRSDLSSKDLSSRDLVARELSSRGLDISKTLENIKLDPKGWELDFSNSKDHFNRDEHEPDPELLALQALIPKNLKEKLRKDPTKYNSANLLKKDPLDLRTCPICERKFYRAEHLRRHLTSVHNNEKPFTCGVCHKNFTRKDNLHQHQRRKHDDREIK